MDCVLCDAHAFDTQIDDPDILCKKLLGSIQDGSIVVVHMPSKNFRKWCLKEIENLCEAVTRKGFKIVSYEKMKKLAHESIQQLA